MPSAASRREAFTRSGAGGSLDIGSAGTEGPDITEHGAAERGQLFLALRCAIRCELYLRGQAPEAPAAALLPSVVRSLRAQ
jgi:hypothetical protein